MPSGTEMKIYIASRFTNANLVLAFANKIRTMSPHPVQFTMTWPTEIPQDGSDISYLADIAYRDIRQIDEADTIIVLTEECELVPGGMHFEAGYANALGKQMIVVGPRVNVFYNMQEMEWYPTIQDYLKETFGDVK